MASVLTSFGRVTDIGCLRDSIRGDFLREESSAYQKGPLDGDNGNHSALTVLDSRLGSPTVPTSWTGADSEPLAGNSHGPAD